MSVTAAIRDLIAKGFTVEQALEAAEAFEAAMTPARSARQDRNARYYQNKKATKASEKRLKASEPSYSDESVLNQTPSRGPTRVEDNLQTKNITGQEERKKTPRDELAAVLDPERAAAVVDHRQKMRRPLTGHAARLLANRLSQAPDPNSAADLMIEKGWQSFELEWLSRPARQATAPPPQQAQDFNTILDAMQGKHHEPEHSGPTIEASFARGDRGGAADIVQLHAFSARG